MGRVIIICNLVQILSSKNSSTEVGLFHLKGELKGKEDNFLAALFYFIPSALISFSIKFLSSILHIDNVDKVS